MPYCSSSDLDVVLTVRYEQFSKYGKEIPFLEAKIAISNDPEKMDKSIFNQFFVIKDVFTKEEADSLIRMSSTKRPITYLPKIQKELEKLEKKKAKKGELEGKDKTLYANLKNEPQYYSIKIGDETAYSQTVDNGTLIGSEYYKFLREGQIGLGYSHIVWLMEDTNGTEYLIYIDRGRSTYITENRINYLKGIYVNQDVARFCCSGQITGDVFRCEDLVIYRGDLRAKCRNLRTQEIEYFWLHYWQSGEEMIWQLEYDSDRYDIVVL